MTMVWRLAGTVRRALGDMVWHVQRHDHQVRQLHEIEQRCRIRLEQLEPAIPWHHLADVEALCRLIGAQRERPIHLETARLPPDLSGLWLPGTSADYIFSSWDTVPAQRGHVILHELSHILCGHHALVADAEALLRPQLPLLDSDAIRQKLGRSHYDTASEREAETLATLLMRRWEAARPLGDRANAAELADGDPEARRLRWHLDDFTTKLREK